MYRSFSNKVKSLILLLFNGPEVLTSAASKAELFANQFRCNSTLDDTGHVLPKIQHRTEANHITPTMIIKSFDSSKATGSNEIPAAVLLRCSPELSHPLQAFKEMHQRVLFSFLLETGICCPCIQKLW